MKGRNGREQELAGSVQATKVHLLALLTADEQRTKRLSYRGKENKTTFEDAARKLADKHSDPRAPAVFLALAEFQSCVNALWTHAIDREVPSTLVNAFLKKHRGLKGIERADLEAEAYMTLREHIIRFEPGDTSLEGYAYRGVLQHLSEWVAQQGPLELTQKVARGELARGYRRAIDPDTPNPDERGVHIQPEQETSYDPTAVVERCLDVDLKHASVESFEESE